MTWTAGNCSTSRLCWRSAIISWKRLTRLHYNMDRNLIMRLPKWPNKKRKMSSNNIYKNNPYIFTSP